MLLYQKLFCTPRGKRDPKLLSASHRKNKQEESTHEENRSSARRPDARVLRSRNGRDHGHRQAGIAFVHQELNLFNDLKVYENIFLRKEILTKARTLDKKKMIAQTAEFFENLGVDIDPTATVSELETSKKQLLEIAKALHANAKLLILDEPTTALNNREIEHLFGIIRRLKEGGKSFIFISHKMTEIFTIADRYTVLRNGQMIKTSAIRETTPTEVTRLMVGNSYSDSDIYAPRELGENILEMENYTGPGFEKKFSRLRALLNIRCNGEGNLITSLSGGNQQKVILARWLNTNADVLLMDNPTQGIDVGAKAEIYRLILQLAQRGKTILVNTLEIPELQKVGDRCVVFHHGHVQQVLSHVEITEERVMLAATNAINAAEGAVGQ